MKSMERWYQAIAKRSSVRHFKSSPDDLQINDLSKFADSISANGVRIVIARSSKIFATMLGGSGKVRGTDCFAAFISDEGKTSTVGYVGEIFVLECVARGFGTCWLGASFRMGAAQAALELLPGETIACVTPIGTPDEPFKLRSRRSIASLTGLSVQEYAELPDWQQTALEAARRAPSAINAQPWEFEPDNGSIVIYNSSSNMGYGALDCGIAMLHIELGAAHHKRYGEWNIDDSQGSAEFILGDN